MGSDADRETYRDDGRRCPSDLADQAWGLIAPLVSGYDPLTADLREMVNACLYLEKTGCPWRHLPTEFGPRPTVRTWHDRFRGCALLGFQFAPHIPDLAKRRLYGFGKPADYPTLAPLIGGRINVALIRAHWHDILRIVTSLRAGTVTASVIMRQLASHPRQNGIATALCEIGRMEGTLFTLDWIEDPELRRSTGHELNKGETRNSLARTVFLHRLGEIRDRAYENQQHRALVLNLVVTAVILWNTGYLKRALAKLRDDEAVPDHLLAHLSPLRWGHINLTGDYIWPTAGEMTETTVGSGPHEFMLCPLVRISRAVSFVLAIRSDIDM